MFAVTRCGVNIMRKTLCIGLVTFVQVCDCGRWASFMLDKAMGIQNNLFQALKIDTYQENTAQKRLRLTFTKTEEFLYILSRIKSPLDNIMRGLIKGIGVKAKGNRFVVQ